MEWKHQQYNIYLEFFLYNNVCSDYELTFNSCVISVQRDSHINQNCFYSFIAVPLTSNMRV